MEVERVRYGDNLYWQSIALREEILRKPLGLSLSPDDLEAERQDTFLVAKSNDEVVGCLVLTRLGEHTVRMRQVAVAAKSQGLGVGTLLVSDGERRAHELGFQQVELHARTRVVPFYERMNYQCDGPEFVEVGIPHRKMIKTL